MYKVVKVWHNNLPTFVDEVNTCYVSVKINDIMNTKDYVLVVLKVDDVLGESIRERFEQIINTYSIA